MIEYLSITRNSASPRKKKERVVKSFEWLRTLNGIEETRNVKYSCIGTRRILNSGERRVYNNKKNDRMVDINIG